MLATSQDHARCRPDLASQGSTTEACYSRRFSSLFQFLELGSGFFQDRNVGIGVFPEVEEVLVFSASLGGVTGHCVTAGHAKVGKRTQRKIDDDAGVVQEFLELRIPEFVFSDAI